MRRLKPFGTTAALFATALLAFVPQANAHTISVFGPEAENRDRDAGFCAPDGERVRAFAFTGASNGQVLELPHDGCWAEFDVILAAAAPLSVKLHPPGGSGEQGRLLVRAVQSVSHIPVLVWSGATQTLGPGTALVCSQSNVILPAGEYTIRLTSDITSGPDWANQYLDYVSISGTCI